MKQYKVFRHPTGAIEAVKQGWSWPAFFFNFIWAMLKKMWMLGGGVLVAFFVFGIVLGLSGASDVAAEGLMNVVAIVVNIVFGMNGNAWREKNLLSRGFESRGTFAAANPEGAIALLLQDGRTAVSG